jgi:glucan phosphoethanolaminetransferase (alkaline phosphatase superfamily)
VALKLFRTTGYSSLLAAGEDRVGMHPRWVTGAVSTWAGTACNVAIWRALSGSSLDTAGIAQAIALGMAIAGASMLALSILGWRRTLKFAATLVLVLAALAACAIWVQALPMDARLLDKHPQGVLLPPWASLLGWQVPLLLAALAVPPVVWVWHSRLRRLSARQQVSVNLLGAMLGAAMLATGWFTLAEGLL